MIEYILKSSVAIAVAYLMYYLFLRHNTNFKWLRWYFLTALIVSLTLPALKYLPSYQRTKLLSIPIEYVPNVVTEIVTGPQLNQTTTSSTTVEVKHITFSEVVLWIYYLGLFIVFLRTIIGLLQLVILVLRHDIQKIGTNRFVLVNDLPCPFSFFHLVFISRNDLNNIDNAAVIQHEQEHIRQLHSLDLFLLDFISAFQWFNPFVWFIRSTVAEIHEYLADEETIGKQISPLKYQQLLLNQVSGSKLCMSVNGFKSSLTKKRILMITNNTKNRKWFGIFIILIFSIMITYSFNYIGLLKASTREIKNEFSRTLDILIPSAIKKPVIAVNNKNKEENSKKSQQEIAKLDRLNSSIINTSLPISEKVSDTRNNNDIIRESYSDIKAKNNEQPVGQERIERDLGKESKYDETGNKIIILGVVEYDYSQLERKNFKGIDIFMDSKEEHANLKLPKKRLQNNRLIKQQFISLTGNEGIYKLYYRQNVSSSETDGLLILMNADRSPHSSEKELLEYAIDGRKILNIGKLIVKYQGGKIIDGKINYSYSFQTISNDTLALSAFKETYPEKYYNYSNNIYTFKDK